MLSIISILIVYITTLNVIILIALFIKRKNQVSVSKKENFISVIVAFRNEIFNLETLISSLSNQNYPVDKFEVILVDDFSEDDSFKLAQNLISDKPNFRLIKNAFNPGKKNALKTGIANARGEILLFTDADCIPKQNWIKSINDEFDENIDLVYGYSPFVAEKSLVNYLARYENLFTSILMTAFHNAGYPYMSYGRNLSYRKSLFEKLGGFEKIQKSLSGDDDLFLQLTLKHNANVKLIENADSIVFTKCARNFKSYIRQKSRHISASKFYPIELKIILALIYGGNISLNIFLVIAMITLDPFLLSFIFFNWVIKVLSINIISSIIKVDYPFYIIPFAEFLYSLILIFSGVRSRLRIVNWK